MLDKMRPLRSRADETHVAAEDVEELRQFVQVRRAEDRPEARPARVFLRRFHEKPFLSFCTTVLLAMAVVFELPLFVVGLTRLGILTTTKLRKNRRIGYFLVVLVGLALPGPDIITTTLEIIPLVVLYELSIWLSLLLDRRAARLKTQPA